LTSSVVTFQSLVVLSRASKPTAKLHLNACNTQCCNLFLQLEVVNEKWILFTHTMSNRSTNLHKTWFFLSFLKIFLAFFLFDLINPINVSFFLNLLSFLLSLLMFIVSLEFVIVSFEFVVEKFP
jgi:hypothetical protein